MNRIEEIQDFEKEMSTKKVYIITQREKSKRDTS